MAVYSSKRSPDERSDIRELVVLAWPPERQAGVEHMLKLMQEQNNSSLRLTDEQAAEVRRRLAKPSARTIPAEGVFKRSARLKMKVSFEPAASDELDRIFAWIAKDNPRAALNMIARIEDEVTRLVSPELTCCSQRRRAPIPLPRF